MNSKWKLEAFGGLLDFVSCAALRNPEILQLSRVRFSFSSKERDRACKTSPLNFLPRSERSSLTFQPTSPFFFHDPRGKNRPSDRIPWINHCSSSILFSKQAEDGEPIVTMTRHHNDGAEVYFGKYNLKGGNSNYVRTREEMLSCFFVRNKCPLFVSLAWKDVRRDVCLCSIDSNVCDTCYNL